MDEEPETRSGRGVGGGHDGHRQGRAAEKLPYDPPMDRLVQREQSRRRDLRIGVRLQFLLQIQCDELHLAVAADLDGAMGEHADGRVQHAAAERVAVRRDIGAAAGETQAQRRPRAHLRHPCRVVEQRPHIDRRVKVERGLDEIVHGCVPWLKSP